MFIAPGSRPVLRAVALAILMAVTRPPAFGDVVQIPPEKDNTLYQSTGGSLSNGAGQHMFSGRTATGSRRRAIMQFDVDGAVPAGSTITSVVLTLYMSRTTAAVQTHTLRRVNASWGEGTSDAGGEEGAGAPSTPNDATWLHRFFNTTNWTVAGGEFAAVASASIPVDSIGFYSWGPTPQMILDVQGWLDNPATNFGWLIVGNEAVSGTSKRFDTRENPTLENHPVLTITFTPPAGCPCPADVNADTRRDGLDVESFVACLLGGGSNCDCADVNGGGLDESDIADFVAQVIDGSPCL